VTANEPPSDSRRLDAEWFAIESARRGVPAQYWPDGLAAAEELFACCDDCESDVHRPMCPRWEP
jgi:hypothetical protein